MQGLLVATISLMIVTMLQINEQYQFASVVNAPCKNSEIEEYENKNVNLLVCITISFPNHRSLQWSNMKLRF